ncbi:MAG: PDZ domain-containing protein [Bacteroidales bacterium]
MKKCLIFSLFAVMIISAGSVFASSTNKEARLLRFPAVGNNNVVFTFAGDLYLVDINGGAAKKLTSDIGYEMFARFSPDGKTLAFTAQYDGNTEIYTMPADGGTPKRITYTASVDRDNVGDRIGPNNIAITWTPNGKDIIYRSRSWAFCGMRGVLMQVAKDGGIPQQLPLTEGGFCSFSPDGKYLALNRMFREFRTWKYYEGGQADDIWLANLKDGSIENLTNNKYQDIFPMYIGREIYFISSRDKIMNLFVYNLDTKATEKLTDFKEYDIKFPSNSQDYIVFENGGYIYKYSIKDKSCNKIPITLNDEGNYARAEWKDASKRISAYSISPKGERVLLTARGDVFSVPAKEGAVINLTKTNNAQERGGVFSPDGKWYAYFSDKLGEYEVYIAPANRSGEPKQLTKGEKTYKNGLQWAPDSKSLLYLTETKCLYNVDLQGVQKLIYRNEKTGIRGVSISPCGKWIAFSAAGENKISIVNLMELSTGKIYPITDKWYDSGSAIFSADGKYLYFTSSRDLNSQYASNEWNILYNYNDYIFIVPLSANTPNPFLATNNEENATDAGVKADTNAKKEVSSTNIDISGIEKRVVALPIAPGSYRLINALDDKLIYAANGRTLKVFNLKSGKSNEIGNGSILDFTADNKKVLYSQGGKLSVIPFSESLKAGESVPVDGLKTFVEYPNEWKQIFDETWRVYRDGFYVKNMHGKDWQAIHDKYAVLLPYVKHRQDLTYIIGEMISELTVGHAYVTTGNDIPAHTIIKSGLLGAKFTKDNSGCFKIEKIYKGANWSENLRSPLTEYGLNITPGMYILAINNYPCNEMIDVNEALIGTAGQTIELLVNNKPTEVGARRVYVKPIESETQLAYYEWVQGNIEKVEKLSGGEIGYIHIPDMSTVGLDEFTKLFYTQLDKKALIIDDRMNGGGNVSPIIIEKLSRIVYRMSMARNGGEPSTIPDATHYGPKVLLVDKYAASDGDLFPYSFKQLKLGKLIGTRTWGGIVGISGSKPYLDLQDVRTPFFTSYSVETGDWIVENHGVDPDIIIDNNPFDEYKGIDKQIEKAVEVLKQDLKNYKPLPSVPKDPIR